MMYLVHVLRPNDRGGLDRGFLGVCYDLAAARHLADCATLGNAEFAFVKEVGGRTQYVSEAIDTAVYYDERPMPKPRSPG